VLAGRGGFQPAGTNPQAIVNSIRRTLSRESKSEYSGVDFKASREIYNLPAGPIGMAVGIEFRREKLNDKPDAQSLAGDILNFGSTRTDGKRDADSQFVEFSIPLTAQIESQLAARRDNYSDFGNKISPKVGFKFKPSPSFLFRANYSQGFRAPSLPQNSNSDSTAFQNLFDYAGCYDAAGRPVGAASACQGFALGTGTSTGVVFQGNPALKPETSKSTTLGLLFAPSADMSVSFDWYQIDWRNIVSAIDTNAELYKEYLRNVVGVPGININPGVRFFRSSADGALIGVTNQFSNLDRTRTSGFDVAYQQRFATGFGRLGLQLDATYVATFETSSPTVNDNGDDILDTTELAGRNNGALSAFPRWRGRAAADLERGDFNFRLAANYVGSYRQGAITTNFRGERRPTTIREFATYDLGVTYRFSRQLTAIFAVRNLFDAIAPFDPRMTSLGFAGDQYAPVRRQIVLSGRYRF
jgi:iron complex outermembrane receptor protein